jgi:hypothetical protein
MFASLCFRVLRVSKFSCFCVFLRCSWNIYTIESSDRGSQLENIALNVEIIRMKWLKQGNSRTPCTLVRVLQVDSRPAVQEIADLLWSPKVHDYVPKNPSQDAILSHMNSKNTLRRCFFNIHFIILFQLASSLQMSQTKIVFAGCPTHLIYPCYDQLHNIVACTPVAK